MKNYTYGWLLKQQGYKELPESDYTERKIEMKRYVDILSDVVVKAKCGWDGVKYKVMQYGGDGSFEQFMVLHTDNIDHGRWIPINGNSMGLNLQVLGENLW